MFKLFYTIEKQTECYSDVQECTGWKNIRVYEIINNQPKLWFEIEALNSDSSEEEIQTWLDNNGYGDREYEFTEL